MLSKINSEPGCERPSLFGTKNWMSNFNLIEAYRTQIVVKAPDGSLILSVNIMNVQLDISLSVCPKYFLNLNL